MVLPKFAKQFDFDDWSFDHHSGELRLNYQLEKYGKVTERYHFGAISGERFLGIQVALKKAIQLLHWMAGVSYYKTGLAQDIVFTGELPNRSAASWLQQTWYHGLGELAYQHGISLADHIQVRSTDNQWHPEPIELQPRSLVAIGGGKDSLVSIELLKQHGEDISLFMVGQSEFIESVAATTDCSLLQVKRYLDPRLGEINADDVFNGHVPITAINNCVAAIAALLHDYDAVVFSNEASANQPNVITEAGEQINHQYSKSFAYEQQWQKLIHDYITPDLKVFSLLRPFSELAIVRYFSQLSEYFPVFSSCNRNFHLAGSQNQHGHWCGQCPKCHFVFLILAPFVDQKTVLAIFKNNFLDDVSNEQSFRELLGLSGIKPFECVGEIHESRLALQWLSEHPDWIDVKLVQVLSSEIEIVCEDEIEDMMSFHDVHLIPNRFLSALDKMRR
ncbi:hypothetical protein [Marinicella sp. W31]|uniref:hypothetical protein n=1 Tax=Marinicella sp. W31 TaxID=3023713 RepID=UPI0037570ABE